MSEFNEHKSVCKEGSGMASRNYNQETGSDNQQESCIEKYMFTAKVSASDGVASDENLPKIAV